MTQISAVVTEQKEAKRHYVQKNIFNFDALIKTNFPITQSKCLDLGNQFWEISFLQNQLIDDSALMVVIVRHPLSNVFPILNVVPWEIQLSSISNIYGVGKL